MLDKPKKTARTRWTFKEDEFLAEYFEAAGDYIGTHDLGRPEGAATRRVSFLKKSGAWDALFMLRMARLEYYRAVGPVAYGPELLED